MLASQESVCTDVKFEQCVCNRDDDSSNQKLPATTST